MISPQQHGRTASPPSSSAVAEAAPTLPWSVTAGAPATEGCDALVVWTPAERRLLEALPEPGEVLDEHVWCGLEHDHEGPHWALAQVSADDFWWLRWSDTAMTAAVGPTACTVVSTEARRELVHHTVCARTRSEGETGEPGVPCALPVGHAGAHSYTRPA